MLDRVRTGFTERHPTVGDQILGRISWRMSKLSSVPEMSARLIEATSALFRFSVPVAGSRKSADSEVAVCTTVETPWVRRVKRKKTAV